MIASFTGNTMWPARDGAVFFSLPPAQHIKIGEEFDATGEITFGDDQPLKTEPVVPTLHQLTQLVGSIIDTFGTLKGV